jgi:peptidyl-prolyl cis-trans isomerase SurA
VRPYPTRLTVLATLVGLAGAVPVATKATMVWAQGAALKPSVNDDAAAKPPGEKANPRTAKASPEGSSRTSSATQSIVALVNDEPITGYEIEERMRLALLGAPELQRRMQARLKSPAMNEQFKAFAIKALKANPPKSEAEQQARVKQLQGQFVESIKGQVEADFRPTARKNALDELIEERLKLQEAKRLNVVAANEDVDRVVNGMAERNKMTPQQFAEHMAKMGANISAMRQRITASLSWADVIRRRFGHQIAVAGRDIDRFVATAEGQDEVELRVHRILIATPADLGQNQVAQRLSEAERLRAKFDGCKSTDGLARGIAGARFDDLGHRRPSSIPEPTRSLLLSARDDEMLPPTIGEGGIELWAVCGRKVIKAEEVKRETAENDLRQKEFEILSKKHLKDLRQDAHIEYR